MGQDTMVDMEEVMEVDMWYITIMEEVFWEEDIISIMVQEWCIIITTVEALVVVSDQIMLFDFNINIYSQFLQKQRTKFFIICQY